MRPELRRLCICLAALPVLGCARPPEPVGTAPGPAEAARHRAALATLRVDNRTGEHLAIIFRPAAGAGGPVGVGSVAPRSVAHTAPLPAGEPVVLMARLEDGRIYTIAARTLEVDQEWTWIVPPDAEFR